MSNAIPSDIKSLTSLRFVAAMAVVLFHFRDHMGFEIEAYTQLLKTGHLAVDFFFMLSGFIMAHVYAASVEKKEFSFTKYMGKRFARLYPMHIVTLILFVILGVLFQVLGFKPNIPEKYDFSTIPSNLLMIHAWGINEHNTFNTPSWSISAEWLAYILFLPLMVLFLKMKNTPAIGYVFAIGVFVGFYVAVPVFMDKPLTGLASDFGILRIIPEFILGIATYLISMHLTVSKNIAQRSVLLCLTALVICAHFKTHDFVFIALFSMILFMCTQSARYEQTGVLSHNGFVFLGKISYALYMTHALIYTVFFNGTELVFGEDMAWQLKITLWAVAVMGTIPLAAIFYFVIEEPGRKFLNARFNSKSKQAAS